MDVLSSEDEAMHLTSLIQVDSGATCTRTSRSSCVLVVLSIQEDKIENFSKHALGKAVLASTDPHYWS